MVLYFKLYFIDHMVKVDVPGKEKMKKKHKLQTTR